MRQSTPARPGGREWTQDRRTALRRKFVAGNWKLNKTVEESVALAKELKAGIGSPSCDVAVAPTFLSLYAVAETLKGSGIAVAGQNTFWKESGAYTGQVSPQLLLDAGATLFTVGFGGPHHDMGLLKEWIAWRDDRRG